MAPCGRVGIAALRESGILSARGLPFRPPMAPAGTQEDTMSRIRGIPMRLVFVATSLIFPPRTTLCPAPRSPTA